MTKPSIGVIGIGRMGGSMAKNLLAEGYNVHIFDIKKEAMETLTVTGAKAHFTPAEVADVSSIIILSLLQPKTIEQVLFGDQGICSADIKNKIIIDTSTCVPSLSKEWASRVKELGGDLLDAPVTGGEWGAQQGTLTFMVGGEENAFEKCMPVFKVLGENIVKIGESGAGQTAKMANQMIMSSYYASIAETFAYVEKLGVSVEKVLDAIENGGGQSSILSGFGRQYREDQMRICSGEEVKTDRHYPFIFKKDLFCALQDGYEHNCYMPMSAAAHEVLKQTFSAGTEGQWPIRILDMWRRCLGGNEKW